MGSTRTRRRPRGCTARWRSATISTPPRRLAREQPHGCASTHRSTKSFFAPLRHQVFAPLHLLARNEMCMHAKRFVCVICPWCRGGEVGADIYQTIHNLRSNGKNPIGVKSSTHNAGFLLNAYSPRSQTWSARTQTKVLSAPWSLYVTAVLRGPFLRFSISRTLTSASYGPMEEPARSTTSLAKQHQAPRVLSPPPTDQTRAAAAHPPPASVPRAPARLIRV